VQYHITYFVPLRFIKLIDNDFSIIYKGYKMEDGRKTTAGIKNRVGNQSRGAATS
jgi:hypothetical protein